MQTLLESLFSQLGYTSKETTMFIELYKLGNQPASTIAKRLGYERTGVYKSLLRMASDGLINQTKTKGVTHFFVTSAESPLHALRLRQQQLGTIEQQYDQISSYLRQFEKNKYLYLPKITLFDGIESIRTLYRDIVDTVLSHNYLVIKFFASNTFESQTSVHITLKEYAADLFRTFNSHHISVDTYLGNGILLMEQISKTTSIQNLNELPAGNASVNIFVAGKFLYLIIFRDIPFGIKIDSEDVANTMHFLLEKVQIE